MDTVVVQAHPLLESYNGALLERVCAGLSTAGVDHRVFRIGEGDQPTPGDLAGVGRLVLIHPTWWGGQPAMLLDWLQRMDGAAAFADIHTLEVVTSMGSSRLVNTIQGQWGRRFLAKRILDGCARGARIRWHALHKIDRQPPTAIAAFLDTVEASFARPASAGRSPAR